jgi:protein-disulfide isomerase
MNVRLAAAVLLSGMGLPAQQGLLEGRADSPVRVIIYEDLQCPDCADFRLMLDRKILPKYGDRAAFLHRDFPLAKHAWARRAAIAARFFAAHDPKLGLEYRRHTMAAIAQTTAANFNEKLAAFARAHGVDPGEAVSALGNPDYAAAVEKDFQEGVARGVAHTPTVFVNGQPFVETFTFEEISRGIDQAIAETK